MRILVAMEPADFRKGIDGLCRISRDVMKADPYSGYVFVFCNRIRTSIKILTYDGQGFWLCQKRLSKGRFGWWKGVRDEKTCILAAHELQQLLWNGNPGVGENIFWSATRSR
jgi:transposase